MGENGRGQVHADEKFLSGAYTRDGGDIVLDGRPLPKQYSTLEARGIRCGYHLPGIKPYVRNECHGKCICVP